MKFWDSLTGCLRMYSLKSGGAGIYSEFVHMDVGRLRHWGEAAV